MCALEIVATWMVVGITRAILSTGVAVCKLVILAVAAVAGVTMLCGAVTYWISAFTQRRQEQGGDQWRTRSRPWSTP